MPKPRSRAGWGATRQLPSKRWQASHPHPDDPNLRVTAPHTFRTKSDAQIWLAKQRTHIDEGTWKSEHEKQQEAAIRELERTILDPTFGYYAQQWLSYKKRELSPTTWRTYESYYRNHLAPEWEHKRLTHITTMRVRNWISTRLSPDHPGARQRAYEIFRAILNTAVEDGLIPTNPCKRRMLRNNIKANTARSSRHEPRALTASEVTALADNMPPNYRTLTLLFAILGLRLGEGRELRLKDYDPDAGTLNVHRSATGAGKRLHVTTPKTRAGHRTIQLGPELVQLLDEHIQQYGITDPEQLLFPSSENHQKHFGERSIQIAMTRACKTARIQHASPHDLRHTAASHAGQTPGTTPKDLQKLLGHETPGMSLKYTHANPTTQKTITSHNAQQILNSNQPHATTQNT